MNIRILVTTRTTYLVNVQNLTMIKISKFN